jgi:hypothetical protein
MDSTQLIAAFKRTMSEKDDTPGNANRKKPARTPRVIKKTKIRVPLENEAAEAHSQIQNYTKATGHHKRGAGAAGSLELKVNNREANTPKRDDIAG